MSCSDADLMSIKVDINGLFIFYLHLLVSDNDTQRVQVAFWYDLQHPSCSNSCGTVCDANFWLELNYLEVAKAAQSCSAHFTALLYTEIYVDKIKANMEESCR